MWEPVGTKQHQAPLAAVKVACGDGMQLGVHPVQSLRYQVQGKSVGPFHVKRGDHLTVRAVHASSFDFGIATPVAPVQPSGKKFRSLRDLHFFFFFLEEDYSFYKNPTL